MNFLKLFRSKTVWGAIISQIPSVLAAPKDPNTWVQSVGIIVGVAGARDALDKQINKTGL